MPATRRTTLIRWTSFRTDDDAISPAALLNSSQQVGAALGRGATITTAAAATATATQQDHPWAAAAPNVTGR